MQLTFICEEAKCFNRGACGHVLISGGQARQLTEERRLDRNARTKADGDAGQFGSAMLELVEEKQNGGGGHVAKLFQDVIRSCQVAMGQAHCLLKTP